MSITHNLYGLDDKDSLFIDRHVKLRNLVIENPTAAFEAAHTIKLNEPDLSDQGLALLIMGNSKWALGDYPRALKLYYDAMQMFEESDNTYGKITIYNDASLIYIEEMDYEES